MLYLDTHMTDPRGYNMLHSQGTEDSEDRTTVFSFRKAHIAYEESTIKRTVCFGVGLQMASKSVSVFLGVTSF